MGGRAHLGGENRRAHGGAVSLLVARVSSCLGFASLVGSVFLLNFSLMSCSRQSAPLAPDAAILLQAVPAADPSKFPSLTGSKHWSNPYLVIRPEAVGLLTDVAANEEQILKPEEVLNTLARLPASAWPYGRAAAILVEQTPTTSEQDKIALRRNRGIVAGDLERAHVAINWIAAP
jgi:hypothetical protein